jgi:hypothetical protein
MTYCHQTCVLWSSKAVPGSGYKGYPKSPGDASLQPSHALGVSKRWNRVQKPAAEASVTNTSQYCTFYRHHVQYRLIQSQGMSNVCWVLWVSIKYWADDELIPTNHKFRHDTHFCDVSVLSDVDQRPSLPFSLVGQVFSANTKLVPGSLVPCRRGKTTTWYVL